MGRLKNICKPTQSLRENLWKLREGSFPALGTTRGEEKCAVKTWHSDAQYIQFSVQWNTGRNLRPTAECIFLSWPQPSSAAIYLRSVCLTVILSSQAIHCIEWLSKHCFFEVFFLFLFQMLSNLAPSKIWRLVFKGNMFWKSVGNLPWPDAAAAIFVHVWMNAWDNETSGYAVILQWCGPAKHIPV